MALDMFWGGTPLPERTDQDDQDFFGYDNSDDSDNNPAPYRGPPRQAAKAKLRVPGGIAPTSKRITADYDSDDARIIELKQQLYTDEYVANVLQQEGRIRYQAKTVGSRWQRLRRILYDKADEQLDDELSDWHIEEDELLNSIVADVEKKYERQRENLENKKWQEISLHLAEKLGTRKYTGKACRERFQGLEDGTALIPIELDEDQDGRRRLREERIAKNKQARVDAENAVRESKEAKKARQLAKKKEREDAEQARVAALDKRRAEKAERERIKEERRINKEHVAQQRRDAIEHMKLQRDWDVRKRKAERELCKEYSGGNGLNGKPAHFTTRKSKHGYLSDDEDDDFINDLESDENEDEDEDEDEDQLRLSSTDDDDDDDDDAVDEGGNSDDEYASPPTTRRRPVRKAATKSPTGPKVTRTQIMPSRDTSGGGITVESMKEKAKTYVSVFNKAPVTKQSLQNPRSIMSNDELGALLTFRRLPRRNDESHAEVVSRLAFADEDLKGAQLDTLLANHLIKAKGLKKMDKIHLLQEADAARSEQGQMGVSSMDLEFMRRYEGYVGPLAGLVAEAERERGEDESIVKKDSVGW